MTPFSSILLGENMTCDLGVASSLSPLGCIFAPFFPLLRSCSFLLGRLMSRPRGLQALCVTLKSREYGFTANLSLHRNPFGPSFSGWTLDCELSCQQPFSLPLVPIIPLWPLHTFFLVLLFFFLPPPLLPVLIFQFADGVSWDQSISQFECLDFTV